MAQINPHIRDYRPKDYAGVDNSRCEVDCSLGVNFWQLPARVTEQLAQLPQETIKHYPHELELLPLLIERFAPAAALTAENFLFGCGSYDLLCNINLLYAGVGRAILGHAPQFSAYVDNAHCIGADYHAYPFDPAQNYRMDTDAFCEQIRAQRPALVCCENPNNPTGQSLTPHALEQIIRAAQAADAAVVFDEAYADYLPIEDSAAAFVPRYEHVFVTRTFSKGFGMPGMRIGYVIGQPASIVQLGKLVTPFNCNGIARRLAHAALTDSDYLVRLPDVTREMNGRLYAALAETGKFRIAATDVATPISLLYVDDPAVDLCALLNRVGIASVSGLCFANLGQNAVRVMLCAELDRLIVLLRQAALLP